MLSLPLVLAACSAGLVGGVHCLGMCGSLNWLMMQQIRQGRAQPIIFVDSRAKRGLAAQVGHLLKNLTGSGFFLHLGRIGSYMVIGACFGSLGAATLTWKNEFPIAKIWYVLGNLGLLFIALKILGLRLPDVISRLLSRLGHFWGWAGNRQRGIRFIQKNSLLCGLIWGFMPCGLLYTVAPFAIFTNSAWHGALLMLIFALCALPHLLLAPWLTRLSNSLRYLRYTLAFVLLALGLMGLYFSDMSTMPDFLCVTPI